ncbi:hypothetical protein GN958_ATG12700 [Phytophthora infestans]|uniref:Ankyrin repeat protein n=1 Tax=Phytophthora infestans TaxID=4787 RepID=A0A8S9UBD4_PHYIN|nr:hypothetical protein GN958_ATG12700 [Phytophthora infestans]
MESSAIDYSSMPTRKEILQAFLPSRVAAFTNVIESIDQFAMTPKEAAVLAARNGNVELVRCFLDHVQYDMESVVTAAVETGQSKILDMIWSETRLWCMEIAIRKSKQIRVVKLLYEWLKARGAARRVLRIVLTKSASRGLLDIFEFAIENYVWEFWNKILTQSLSRGARTPGRNQLGRYLDWSPSLQRLFNYAFYKALENVHEDIAGMIYAAYPAYHVRIRDKLLASLVQLGRTSMVEFIYSKGRVTTAASNRVLKIAAACRHKEILIFLLGRAKVSLKTLKQAIQSALRAKSFAVVEVILLRVRLPLVDVLQDAFQEAESVDAVQFLLETKQIAADAIRSKFESAVEGCLIDRNYRRGHAKIVAFLCREGYISRTAAEWTFAKGVDYNCVLLMKSVCNNCCIYPEVGAKMLARAIQKIFFM